MSFEIAYDALRLEAAYVEACGAAEASVTGSIAELPGQVPEWGGWGDIGGDIKECFANMNEKVSTADANMGSIAEVLRQVLDDYRRTEESSTVP